MDEYQDATKHDHTTYNWRRLFVDVLLTALCVGALLALAVWSPWA